MVAGGMGRCAQCTVCTVWRARAAPTWERYLCCDRKISWALCLLLPSAAWQCWEPLNVKQLYRNSDCGSNRVAGGLRVSSYA